MTACSESSNCACDCLRLGMCDIWFESVFILKLKCQPTNQLNSKSAWLAQNYACCKWLFGSAVVPLEDAHPLRHETRSKTPIPVACKCHTPSATSAHPSKQQTSPTYPAPYACQLGMLLCTAYDPSFAASGTNVSDIAAGCSLQPAVFQRQCSKFCADKFRGSVGWYLK